LTPIFAALAPGIGDIPKPAAATDAIPRIEQGYIHAGRSARPFVKMVHNGIEYGLMQAYAEGFDILKNAISTRCPLTTVSISTLPISPKSGRGSVIPSWLLDLTSSALAENHTLDEIQASWRIPGEGRWTVKRGHRRGRAREY